VDLERCDECGFNGDEWTDDAAIRAIAALPDRWRDATVGLSEGDACRRPIADTWSVVEYADHVREVLFAMRFVLDSAASSPGIDLGSTPESSFDPEPRLLDLVRALAGIEREASRLVQQLAGLAPATWAHTALIDGDAVDDTGELFLSVKTVETHVRHIFNKLGVTSRVEVARMLDEAA
jgi:hypothetical protein